MQLVGFNLKKISIEKIAEKIGNLEIKSNIDIEDIKKEAIELSKDKEVLSFNFNFDIDYQPKIASLNFRGNVLVLTTPEESKEIFKKWKKKQMEENIRLMIFNFILIKCNIKALELEDDLGLPSHIPFPKIVKDQQQYTG